MTTKITFTESFEFEVNYRDIEADVVVRYHHVDAVHTFSTGDPGTDEYEERDYTVTRLIEVMEDGTRVAVPITDHDRHLMFDMITELVDALDIDNY